MPRSPRGEKRPGLVSNFMQTPMVNERILANHVIALGEGTASQCPLLQRFENAPIVGQRCAILAPGSADWQTTE